MPKTQAHFYNDTIRFWKSVLVFLLLWVLIVYSVPDVTADPQYEQESSCYQQPDASCVIALALESARAIDSELDRNLALGGIFIAQVKLGLFQQAMNTAQGLNDAHRRAINLWLIAATQAGTGDRIAVQATLQLAVDAASTIDKADTRAQALIRIAKTQIEVGDSAGARATIKQVLAGAVTLNDKNHESTSIVLNWIVALQAQMGDFQQAFDTARAFDTASDRAFVFRVVAEAKAKAGNAEDAQATFQQALNAARTIDEAYIRIDTFRAIAEAQADTGDRQGARATLRQILNNSRAIQEANYSLSILAGVQAKAGDQAGARATLHQALATARTLPTADNRASVFENIALVQAQTGDFKQALSTARAMDDIHARAYTLWLIAAKQVEEGDFQHALTAARAIDRRTSHRAKTLNDIALAHAKVGNFKQAMAVAHAIEKNTYDRVDALLAIVKAQTKMGDSLGAKATLQQALGTAQAIKDAFHRALALRVVAEMQAQMGEQKEAQATFQQALDVAYLLRNGSTVRDIVEAQARAGDFQHALDTARTIDGVFNRLFYRAWAFVSIAEAQARAGDTEGAQATIQQALDSARVINDDSSRGIIMERIVEVQARTKDFKQALVTARTIEAARDRADAFAHIALFMKPHISLPEFMRKTFGP